MIPKKIPAFGSASKENQEAMVSLKTEVCFKLIKNLYNYFLYVIRLIKKFILIILELDYIIISMSTIPITDHEKKFHCYTIRRKMDKFETEHIS